MVLTIAGGLASTVAAPAVVGLLSITGWRETFLVLAGFLAVTTIPIHWFALGLLGAGQIIGRVMFMTIPHGSAPRVPFIVVGVLSFLTMLALGLVDSPEFLLIAIAILAGAVRGSITLVQANAVSERWGTRNYGAINGVYIAPVTIGSALALRS